MTVTHLLVESAARRGDRAALIGPGRHISYARLASIVLQAAAGLAWRGLRPRDVVGVYVPDAPTHVLACHAVRGAGAVPCPVSPDLPVPEVAGQLADCGARMLLTDHPLTSAGLAAADRSWVRQVISFGSSPGTVPFCSLLSMGTLQPATARPHDLALLPYRRAADGSLHPAGLTHEDLDGVMKRLASVEFSEADVVLAAGPAGDGQRYTALLDHALLQGATVQAAQPDLLAAARGHGGTAAIVAAGTPVSGLDSRRVFTVL